MTKKAIKQPQEYATPKLKTAPIGRLSSNTLHPIFDVSALSRGAHPISACTKDEKSAFADKLVEMSQLSWQELVQSNRHKQGYEIIEDYPKPSGLTDDVKIIAFRFYGMAPMIGYRQEQIFRIIALDRTFTAYKH